MLPMPMRLTLMRSLAPMTREADRAVDTAAADTAERRRKSRRVDGTGASSMMLPSSKIELQSELDLARAVSLGLRDHAKVCAVDVGLRPGKAMAVETVGSGSPDLDAPGLIDVEVFQEREIFIHSPRAAKLRDPARHIAVLHVGGPVEGRLIEIGHAPRGRGVGVPGGVYQRDRCSGAGHETRARVLARAEEVLAG